MRIGIVAAVVLSLAATERRGNVTGVTIEAEQSIGVFKFTANGTNPCGAVHLDYGDTVAITYPIEHLPYSASHEYTKTGTFKIRAVGMGNCGGEVTSSVNVTTVKPQPAPPPPPPSIPPPAPPTPATGRPTAPATPAPTPPPAIRFAEMDRNGDRVVTKAEWTGSQQSFRVHDWNGDGILSGDELRIGAQPPQGRAGGLDWSERSFRDLDRNLDGRISRNEWRYDLEDFVRVDRNGDGQLTLQEFLYGDIDDDRGDTFDNLDLNRDNRIERREWHGSIEAFRWLDRNNDGVLSRGEVQSEPNPAGRGGGRAEPGERGRAGGPGDIFVRATERWTDTGLDVRAGEYVTIHATGTIQFSPNPVDVAEPQGAGKLAAPNSPLPKNAAGGLIGRVGLDIFFIGNTNQPIRMIHGGRLFLSVNDDRLGDNHGEFRVTVTRR